MAKGCREREERARQKAAAAAGAFWRRLLAAIFSRARVEAEHNQPAPLQPHLAQPAKSPRGRAKVTDLAAGGASDGGQGQKARGSSNPGKAGEAVAEEPSGGLQEQHRREQTVPAPAEEAGRAAVDEEDI